MAECIVPKDVRQFLTPDQYRALVLNGVKWDWLELRWADEKSRSAEKEGKKS